MKGAKARRLIVTVLALATVALLMTSCPSPGVGTPEPDVHAAGMSRNGFCITVAGYRKSGIWTGLTPLNSTRDSVGYSLSLPATQVVKCNVCCGGGDAIFCAQRAIGHFIEKNKHYPLSLAFPLLAASVSHRALMQKVKRKVMLGPPKANAGSVFHALSLAGCSGGSPSGNGETLTGACWCRAPP
jgi:hypothetical protein